MEKQVATSAIAPVAVAAILILAVLAAISSTGNAERDNHGRRSRVL
jgi:hypothetical protein